MPTPEVLRALLTAPGPSGYEHAASAVWREAAQRFTGDVRRDVMGSSVAIVDGSADGPLVAAIGHIDEIGLIVTHIDDEGMLWFTGVGGWDAQILVGQRVEVQTDGGPRPGVVGKKPIHLLKDDERKKVAELKDLHIDIGARDGDEARSLVRIGDVAVIAGDPVELPNDRVISRSMDNRLGSYIALEAARLVAEAGGAPGPLRDAAEAESIPYTVEASGRSTGTDADAFFISRGGIPTGVVSIPLRYMHSPVEMVQLDDVDACARLIAAFARRLGTDASFER